MYTPTKIQWLQNVLQGDFSIWESNNSKVITFWSWEEIIQLWLIIYTFLFIEWR